MRRSDRLRALRHALTLPIIASAAALAFGCSSSGPSGPHTGSLTVTITSVAGITPAVTVTGPAGYHQALAATQTLAGLAPGSYTIAAARVVSTAPIVSAVATGVVTGSPATVTSGATAAASATYAVVPGSGALWTVNFGAPSVAVDYTANQLGSSTSSPPAVALASGTAFAGGIAVDPNGNVWIARNTPNTVIEYTASQLAASGSPTPAITISTPSLVVPNVLAFDASGNLWVADFNGGAGVVIELTASQLTASGTPTPAVVIGGMAGPEGMAFDVAGDLWVANATGSTVVEFTPSQLGASGSPTPTVTLTDDGHGSLANLLGMAFDQNGNLWVSTHTNSSAAVAEFATSQLAANGNPTPTISLSATGGSLNVPAGLAFDASGDLWVANSTGQTIVEFTASQIVASGSPTPNTVVAGVNTPSGLAFSPHSTALPLH